MPFTAAQIAAGANVTLETYRRNKPIDQVNTEHRVLKWLMDNKEPVTFGNGFYNETIYVGNDSNYQNYFGADPVTYNSRDPVRLAKFGYANYHDGFWFDEDRLKANNIIITDESDAVATTSEKEQLVNLLDVSYTAMRKGIQDGLALETLMDGSTNPKAIQGLDFLVSTTPTVGTVGNIDAATSTYWRNNTALGISTATPSAFIAALDGLWDKITMYGQHMPSVIFVGQAFKNAYMAAASEMVNRQLTDAGVRRGGVTIDPSVTGVFYKGIPLVWDPTFEQVDAKVGVLTHPWTKRAYFLYADSIKFRPMKGAWAVKRKPERLPDRYVHYFGETGSYGMTINQRNANGVASIA